MKNKLNKSRWAPALFLMLTAFVAAPVHATIFSFSGSGGPLMQSYDASWNTSNQELNLSSSWVNPPGMPIDKISFLITDGGSPFLASTVNTEQFLYYTLDLVANTVLVEEYFGRADIASFSGLITSTATSFSLTFDNSALGLDENSFLHQGRTYQPNLFGDDIGIWHYMYSMGTLKETYDVHHSQTTSTVPEPGSLALLGLGLLGMAGGKRILAAKI